jgi:deferrochelatase/peroxidase EfeB
VSPPVPIRIDLDNVQGLIVRPYTHPVSSHELVRFPSPAGARAFLAALVPSVTSGRPWGADVPRRLLNVGLSFTGLQAAGALSPDALTWLPDDFRTLPPPETLGDTGGPPPWWDATRAADFHCLVSLFADTPASLDAFLGDVEGAARGTGVNLLHVRPDGERLRGALFTQKRQLHFGYFDGISAPDIGWADPVAPPQVDFRHYLLGYGTDAIQSTPRPIPGAPPALDEAVRFVADGTYLALRVLYQDVAAFNRFLEDNARRLAPVVGRSQADTAEWLAAKMLGRWRTGEPLALCPDRPDPACSLRNDFDYTDDPHGRKCPPSAHIRVVNPRSQPIDPPHRPVPRLLRRGMPFGPPLPGTRDDGQERGLIGLFLCNSLRTQFEKVLTWVNRNDFAPVFTELGTLRGQDPLLGNRTLSLASQDFLVPMAAGMVKGVGLTTFVQSRGTAYFLLPGLKALRHLAGLG